MTDREALLRCVIESPQDDLPRLVMADWLEENGEPERAEFIRVQCELTRAKPCEQLHCWPGNEHCSGACELRRRERELLHQFEDEWFPLREAIWNENERNWNGLIPVAEWHRGFISSITCDWETFRRHAPALHWHPEQEVDVPSGICHCGESCDDHNWGSGHSPVDMLERVRRPFPPTAQPIETVNVSDVGSHVLEASDWIGSAEWIVLAGLNGERHRFTRVKCSTCDGTGWDKPVTRYVYGEAASSQSRCPTCHVTPPNRWTCDSYRGVVFSMPEAARQPIGVVESVNEDGTVNVRLGQRLDAADDAARERDAEARSERAYHYGDVPAGTRPR